MNKINTPINQKIVIDAGPLSNILACYDENGKFSVQNANKITSCLKDFIFYKNYGTDLLQLLSNNTIIITPHVMTEAINLIKNKKIKISSLLKNNSKSVCHRLLVKSKYEEHYDKISKIIDGGRIKYIDYGLTDCALLLAACKPSRMILTHDNDLQTIALSLKVKAMTPVQWIHSIMKNR